MTKASSCQIGIKRFVQRIYFVGVPVQVRLSGAGMAASGAEPLHDRDGVIGFPHWQKISSILICNTVVPIATRAALESCCL